MPPKVLSRIVGLLLVGWLIVLAVIGWQVRRSQRYLMPDIRVDERLVILEHPLLPEPALLEPFVGQRVERVGPDAVTSVEDLRRLSRQQPLELWLVSPGGSETPVLLLWALARRIPDLQLTDGLTIPAGTAVAETIGLEPGDRILQINGEALSRPEAYRPAMRRVVASPQRLTVFRERTAEEFSLILQIQDQWMNWAIFVAGAAFGLLGFVAYRLRPNARSALAFLLFALTCSLLWFSRAVPFDNRTLVERHFATVLRLMLPLASVFMLLSFTPLRRVVTHHREAIIVTMLAGVGFGTWNLAAYPGYAAEGALAPAVGLPLLALTLGIILVSVSTDWLASLAGHQLLPIDRQRAKALRWATLFGLLPLTLYFLLRFDLRLWCELAVILFPLILAYATVRQNLFQINELLFEGLVYGGLLAGVSTAYAAAVASVVPMATAAFGDEGSWLTFGLKRFS